jgi:hypothetical protein
VRSNFSSTRGCTVGIEPEDLADIVRLVFRLKVVLADDDRVAGCRRALALQPALGERACSQPSSMAGITPP